MSFHLLASVLTGGGLWLWCGIAWLLGGAVGSVVTMVSAGAWIGRRRWPRFFRRSAENAVRLMATASVALVILLCLEIPKWLERRPGLDTITADLREVRPYFAITLAVLAAALWLRAVSRESESEEPALMKSSE